MLEVRTKFSLFPTVVRVDNGYFCVLYSGFGLSEEEEIELPQIHLIAIKNGYFLSQIRITYGVEEREMCIGRLAHDDAVAIKDAIMRGQFQERDIVDL